MRETPGAIGLIGLEDLQLTRAIGEAGTLAGAARRLGVDHSTAFRRLGALEKRLGVRLFERSRDGYTPTPAGEAAIATAAALLEELGTLERQLAGEDLRPSGVVRITTTDTLVDFLLPGLAAFRSAHPEITLELIAANAFFTLTKRDADVAIRPSLTVPDHLVGRRLAAIAMAPYAAPAYLAGRSGTGSLESHVWLGLDESLSHLGASAWMRKHVPPERVVFRSSSLLALQAAAGAGLGVAPLPCYLGDADSTLSRLGPAIPEMASALWLLTHPDLRRVARIRAFLDFMAPWLEQRRDRLEGTVAADPDIIAACRAPPDADPG